MNTQEQLKLDIENGNIEGVKKYIQDGGDVNIFSPEEGIQLSPPHPILYSLQNKEMFELLLNSLDMGEDYFDTKWWEIDGVLISNNEEIMNLYLDKLTTIFPPHEHRNYEDFMQGFINCRRISFMTWKCLIIKGFDLKCGLPYVTSGYTYEKYFEECKNYEVLDFWRKWDSQNIKPSQD